LRCLAIGDIHGCLTALTTLARFAAWRDDDVIVTLGDYVDRGPDSKGVLDWLIECSTRHQLIPLRGNHEVMMLDARRDPRKQADWLFCGGDATLHAYAPPKGSASIADVPAAHWQFLEQTRPWCETDTDILVHASIDPDLPLDQQSDYDLYWQKWHEPRRHVSGKRVICGHSAQESGRPLNVGHSVGIDTWVYGTGWLTCLDVASGRYWQANESGETREDRLENVPRGDA